VVSKSHPGILFIQNKKIEWPFTKIRNDQTRTNPTSILEETARPGKEKLVSGSKTLRLERVMMVFFAGGGPYL